MFFGVTLMELIIALAMLGLGLVAILNMVNGGMTNTDRLRQEIIAINLSREGVETVYNIRNTNRMRRAGQKDACWLKRDSFDTEGNASCSDDQWLISGHYIISPLTTGGQIYLSLTGAGTISGLDLTMFQQGIDDRYSLCYGISGSMAITGRYQCPGQMVSRSEGRFFRDIQGLGLFKKNVEISGGLALSCPSGSDAACGNTDPKEYRFCSKVQYLKKFLGDVTLCGIVTNFVE